MELRRGDTLRTVFFQFFISILGAFLLVGIINILLSFGLIYVGMLRPENYSEKQILSVYNELQNADKVQEKLIPNNVEYVLFDKKFNAIKSSMEENKIEIAKKCLKGKIENDGRDFYFHIQRKDGFITLKYQYKVLYRNEWMNIKLPSTSTVTIVLYLIECIISFIVITLIFSKKVDGEIQTLISAAEKIEKGDLDFDCRRSNIREINKVIYSMEKMKSGLKESLKAQWDIEYKKREEIAALTHDIKTPMTIIKGNAELLEETNLTDEQKLYNNYILESSEELQKYLNILVSTANEEQKKEEDKEKIYIEELVSKIELAAKGMAGKQMDVIVQIEVKEKYILGNKDSLMRALNNIIINGIQHGMKMKGKKDKYLRIKISEKGKYLTIKVQDSGEGFSKKDLIHGREKFYMGDESRGGKSNHGMGLYIADKIIKDHHGNIELENTSEGGCVTVKLLIN